MRDIKKMAVRFPFGQQNATKRAVCCKLSEKIVLPNWAISSTVYGDLVYKFKKHRNE